MFNLPPHITVNLKLLLVIIVIFMVAFLIFSAALVDRFQQTRQLRDVPGTEQSYIQNTLSLPNN